MAARALNKYTSEELVYTVAVAGDLRNQCVRLEASGAGLDHVTSAKKTILADAELDPSFDYGASMKNAGEAGSKYKNYLEAAQEIVESCITIADEVGNQKIGRPANGSAEADKFRALTKADRDAMVEFINSFLHFPPVARNGRKDRYRFVPFFVSFRPEVIKTPHYSPEQVLFSIFAFPPGRNGKGRGYTGNRLFVLHRLWRKGKIPEKRTVDMEIRKATLGDWNELERIFGCARAFMRQSGNGTQWVDGYPSEELVTRDIMNGDCYCLVGTGGRIAGTFTFILGEDPNYKTIYNGFWPNDKPYGTIHRLASDGSEKGVADACFRWCCSRYDTIRADTHRNNAVLRHLLAKYGFRLCGTVRVANGTERLAFQWEKD